MIQNIIDTTKEKYNKERQLDTLSYQEYKENLLKLIEKISNTDYTKWYNKEGVFYYNIDEEFTLYIKWKDKDYRIGVYSRIIEIEFAIYDEKEIEFIQEFTNLLAITAHKNTSISNIEDLKSIIKKL
jgi:hypothetical protein